MNTADIAAIGTYSAVAVAGLGIGIAGAVETGQASKLAKRAPDGSYTEKYKKKKQAKANKKAARKMKKSDKRYEKIAAEHENVAAKFNAANNERNDAMSQFDAVKHYGPSHPEYIAAQNRLNHANTN